MTKGEIEDSLLFRHCSFSSSVVICGVSLSDSRLTLKEGGVTYRGAAGAKCIRALWLDCTARSRTPFWRWSEVEDTVFFELSWIFILKLSRLKSVGSLIKACIPFTLQPHPSPPLNRLPLFPSLSSPLGSITSPPSLAVTKEALSSFPAGALSPFPRCWWFRMRACTTLTAASGRGQMPPWPSTVRAEKNGCARLLTEAGWFGERGSWWYGTMWFLYFGFAKR